VAVEILSGSITVNGLHFGKKKLQAFSSSGLIFARARSSSGVRPMMDELSTVFVGEEKSLPYFLEFPNPF